jgi:transcriptional regulator with XRE-family HTH domain
MLTEERYNEFLKALGARIKELRTQQGLSLRDMIVQHDYHESQWRKYEKGGSLNVHSLLRIADSLGITLSKLLDGLGDFPAEPVLERKTKRAVKKSSKPKE